MPRPAALPPVRLAALDIAGTTVDEGGVVYAVMRDAVERDTGRSVPDAVLSRWSGTGKREGIEGILTALGEDTGRTDRIFDAFSADLDAAYAADPPSLLPGVREAVDAMRSAGAAVVLQTGYTREVAQDLLEVVGWRLGEDLDGLVTVDDVRRSRPSPYLVFRAMELADVQDVREVLVAGDTANDLLAGTRAGAGRVVGVLTGAHTAAELGAVRHTHLLDGVADLPAALGPDLSGLE
ncbi:phosphonatase-like hydrolase [Amnibacterium endophyticum]|uniref:Phosphonatase-like hydrolase n=1 Tax=Amnibacterium endophyticum TaxID=2109337 RepID=A0ABW4LFZ2_9MICO